jgi:hypothetical protein
MEGCYPSIAEFLTACVVSSCNSHQIKETSNFSDLPRDGRKWFFALTRSKIGYTLRGEETRVSNLDILFVAW